MSKKIEIVDASYTYDGENYIWEHLNAIVENGDHVCILGSNGCGKTTLFNCITGNVSLTSGHIYINGKDVREYSVSELAKIIGIVYQDHSIAFPYTSLEVVSMGRAPYLGLFESPKKEDTELAYHIMEELGIANLAEKRYSKISGGQRQLVLIARTLCQQPEVILFDEPTSHLDFKNQAIVMKTIHHLSKMGITTIMTSHLPTYAYRTSNKVFLMANKSILASGTPCEIMNEHNLQQTYGVRVKINKIKDETQCFIDIDYDDI